MAGHSQFKNIMHRKGAQDKKRAKLFTKLAKEIYVAAKTGMPEPDKNPRLRTAIANAKAKNLPKDRIDNAIKKATSSGEGENFEEVRYEGYGAGATPIIVTALTDNRNRTASDVRSTFNKNGGNMGEVGSVSFMFEHKGIIIYPKEVASEEEIMEMAIEAGAEDCQNMEDHYQIICDPKELQQVNDVLNKKLGDAQLAELTWIPTTTSEVSEESKESLQKLVDALEDLDDVQKVYTNATNLE